MPNSTKNKSRGRALFVSPYLSHIGGGERYLLTAAYVAHLAGYKLFFAWNNKQQLTSLLTTLAIPPFPFTLKPELFNFYFTRNPLASFLHTRPFDLVFYLSDGSIPMLGAKKNILHFQVPFTQKASFLSRLKLHNIHEVVVNSAFTKKIIDQSYSINSTVLYPPVQLAPSRPYRKEKLILSVGRFEPSLNVKKHHVLISAFRQLSSSLPDWKLVLAGGAKKGTESWIEHLQFLAKGLPIEIKPNLSHHQLTTLYKKATLYWHAAGFGIDENSLPQLTEHFGITTVEALSYGCVPFVVPKGGQVEIVPYSALHWHSKPELIQKTRSFLSHPQKYLSLASSIDLQSFSEKTFIKNFTKLII